MKLLIITQYFWPENFRINDLVEGLLERGHDVTVLTGLPNYPAGVFSDGYGLRHGPYSESFGRAKVVRVPLLARGQGRGLNLALNYFSFALSASIVGAWRCREQYDAIFVFEPSPVTVGIPARVLSWFKSAPVLFWVQDLWPESLSATGAVKSRVILKTVDHLVRWIYRGCQRVLVQSEAFTPVVRQQGVPQERIRYFPNCAEDLYRQRLAKDAWMGPTLPTGFRMMFAGNFGAAQSMETILDAAYLLKEHADIHWLLVGDGRQVGALRDELAARGLERQVHLMGRHPVEAMPAWYSQADALLVTLRAEPVFSLTIPSKIQSYLACGKPIIGALDGEGARIVRESMAGLAGPAGDAAALAENVLKLYKMSERERADMGHRGYEYYEKHFNRTSLLNQLDAWMKELINERKHG